MLPIHTYTQTQPLPQIQNAHTKEFTPSKYINPCYPPSSNFLFTIAPSTSSNQDSTYSYKIHVFSLCLPVPGLLHITQCPSVPSILLWMAGLGSCQWLCVTLLWMCVCCLTIHLPLVQANGRLNTLNSKHGHAVVLSNDFSFYRYILTRGLNGLNGGFMFAFLFFICQKLLHCFPQWLN